MWYSPDLLAAWGISLLLAPTTLPVVASFPAATLCDRPALVLPRSITLEDDLEPLIRSTLEYSPRFRAQCRALASAPKFSATVKIVDRRSPMAPRAVTIFHLNASGSLTADIEIAELAQAIELIAHEFEHVIEQLDDVDLEALAKTGQARRMRDGAFETNRAAAAGLQVAGEVYDHSPDVFKKFFRTAWRVMMRR